MKCDDPECVQCYPVAARDNNFWRVVIYVMIALLTLLAVLSYSSVKQADRERIIKQVENSK